MKCIKTIKSTKYSEIGDIKRVSDAEAEEKVETGYWVYVPKSEYKQSLSTKKVDSNTVVVEEEPVKPKKSTKSKPSVESNVVEVETKKSKTKTKK